MTKVSVAGNAMFVVAFSAVSCTREVEALLSWPRSVFEVLLAASELSLLATAFVGEGVVTGTRSAGCSGRTGRLLPRNATFLNCS